MSLFKSSRFATNLSMLVSASVVLSFFEIGCLPCKNQTSGFHVGCTRYDDLVHPT